MGRPKGSKNKGGQNPNPTSSKRPPAPGGSGKRSTAVASKPVGLAVGDKIAYRKPLGGSEQVVIESIETHVDKISVKDLTRPETVLYLSNGKWMRGTDYVLSLHGNDNDD
jgi:hypothetical protein